MKFHARIALAAPVAALVLALAIGSASARRLEFSEQHFRIVWSFLKFRNAGDTVRIECPVTLEGSFHSKTLSKISGQLIGVITAAAIGAFATCRERQSIEAISFLQMSLPWHVRYDHFIGTLPVIEVIGVQLIGASILATAFNVHCLYRSTAARPAHAQLRREVNRAIIDVIPSPEVEIPLAEGNALLCPANGFLAKLVEVTAAVTVQGATTKILVELVP